MSFAQCRSCRLALLDVVCDVDGEPVDTFVCQVDETLPGFVGDDPCWFYVSHSDPIPPPTRQCKSSRGEVGGCGTGGCSLEGGGGCGSGAGCGSCGVKTALARISAAAA
jgi:hypothetical protein